MEKRTTTNLALDRRVRDRAVAAGRLLDPPETLTKFIEQATQQRLHALALAGKIPKDLPNFSSTKGGGS